MLCSEPSFSTHGVISECQNYLVIHDEELQETSMWQKMSQSSNSRKFEKVISKKSSNSGFILETSKNLIFMCHIHDDSVIIEVLSTKNHSFRREYLLPSIPTTATFIEELHCREQNLNDLRTSLNKYHGILCISLESGIVCLCDLKLGCCTNCMNALEDVREEKRLCSLIGSSSGQSANQTLEPISTINDTFFGPSHSSIKIIDPNKLNETNEVVQVSTMKYFANINTICIGYQSGCFSMFNLDSCCIILDVQCNSLAYPVSSFVLQEPDDDPMSSLYLWVSRSPTLSKSKIKVNDSEVIAAYHLLFSSRMKRNNMNNIYQSFIASEKRILASFESMKILSNVSGNKIGLSNLKLKPLITRRHLSNRMCIFWELKDSNARQTYFAIFDLSFWYIEVLEMADKFLHSTHVVQSVHRLDAFMNIEYPVLDINASLSYFGDSSLHHSRETIPFKLMDESVFEINFLLKTGVKSISMNKNILAPSNLKSYKTIARRALVEMTNVHIPAGENLKIENDVNEEWNEDQILNILQKTIANRKVSEYRKLFMGKTKLEKLCESIISILKNELDGIFKSIVGITRFMFSSQAVSPSLTIIQDLGFKNAEISVIHEMLTIINSLPTTDSLILDRIRRQLQRIKSLSKFLNLLILVAHIWSEHSPRLRWNFPSEEISEMITHSKFVESLVIKMRKKNPFSNIDDLNFHIPPKSINDILEICFIHSQKYPNISSCLALYLLKSLEHSSDIFRNSMISRKACIIFSFPQFAYELFCCFWYLDVKNAQMSFQHLCNYLSFSFPSNHPTSFLLIPEENVLLTKYLLHQGQVDMLLFCLANLLEKGIILDEISFMITILKDFRCDLELFLIIESVLDKQPNLATKMSDLLNQKLSPRFDRIISRMLGSKVRSTLENLNILESEMYESESQNCKYKPILQYHPEFVKNNLEKLSTSFKPNSNNIMNNSSENYKVDIKKITDEFNTHRDISSSRKLKNPLKYSEEEFSYFDAIIKLYSEFSSIYLSSKDIKSLTENSVETIEDTQSNSETIGIDLLNSYRKFMQEFKITDCESTSCNMPSELQLGNTSRNSLISFTPTKQLTPILKKKKRQYADISGESSDFPALEAPFCKKRLRFQLENDADELQPPQKSSYISHDNDASSAHLPPVYVHGIQKFSSLPDMASEVDLDDTSSIVCDSSFMEHIEPMDLLDFDNHVSTIEIMHESLDSQPINIEINSVEPTESKMTIYQNVEVEKITTEDTLPLAEPLVDQTGVKDTGEQLVDPSQQNSEIVPPDSAKKKRGRQRKRKDQDLKPSEVMVEIPAVAPSIDIFQSHGTDSLTHTEIESHQRTSDDNLADTSISLSSKTTPVVVGRPRRKRKNETDPQNEPKFEIKQSSVELSLINKDDTLNNTQIEPSQSLAENLMNSSSTVSTDVTAEPVKRKRGRRKKTERKLEAPSNPKIIHSIEDSVFNDGESLNNKTLDLHQSSLGNTFDTSVSESLNTTTEAIKRKKRITKYDRIIPLPTSPTKISPENNPYANILRRSSRIKNRVMTTQ